MSFLPPVVMELRAKATEVFATLGEVNAEVAATATETEASSVRMQAAWGAAGKAGKALLLGTVGIGAVVAGFSVEAAAAAQVTEAKLSVAVKNAGGNMEELEPKISKAQASLRAYGFSTDEAKDAIGTLTTALKDPKKALADVGIAADLARAKHIDLSQAALLVAKTSEGQVRGLKSLGIDLPVAAASAAQVAKAQAALAAAQAKANDILEQTPGAASSASKAHKAYEAALASVTKAQDTLTSKQSAGGQLLDGLKGRIKGAADAYSGTLQGSLTAARSGLENIGESIGNKLIPVIVQMIKYVQEAGKWFSQHKAVLDALLITLGSVVALFITIYLAQKAWTGITTIATGVMKVYTATMWLVSAAQKAVAEGSLIAKAATAAWSGITAAATGVQKAWTVAQWLAKASTLEYIGAMIAQKAVLVAGAVATAAATAAQWLFNAAMDANPIGLIILAIAALIAIIVLVITHWKEVSGFLTTTWSHVASFFKTVGDAIAKWWQGFWNGIVGIAKDLFWGYINIYVQIFYFLRDTFVAVGTAIAKWWTGFWNALVAGVTAIFKPIIDWVVGYFRAMYQLFTSIGKSIVDWWNGLWSGFSSIVQSVFKAVANFVIGFFNHVIDAVNGVLGGLNGIAGAIKNITGGAINFSLGKIPHIPSFDVGIARVPGSDGAPQLATIHGGEAILSNDMLSGRKSIPSRVADAVDRFSGRGNASAKSAPPSKRTSMTNHFHTNASPARIQADLGWLLRREG